MTERAGAWVLLALAIGAQIAYPLTHGADRAHLTVAVVILMGSAAIMGAVAALGWRTGLAVVGAAGGIGFAADAIGASTGYPFGAYAYDDALGPKVAAAPVAVALAWVMGAWPAIAAARRLRPAGTRRALAAQIALAALGLWAWDLFLDPQMVADGRWQWSHPRPGLPGVDGVPLSNYGGWLLVSAVIATAGCMLADRSARAAGRSSLRRPVRPVRARIEPGEAQFLWTWFSSTLAHAAFLDLPGSAVWGALGMGAVGAPLMIMLMRDARGSRSTAREKRGVGRESPARATDTAARMHR